LPLEDIVYFADQAHVPYGERSVEELQSFLRHNLAFLDERGADAIVMGCNTSCAIAMRFGWPDSRARVLDLIDAAAEVVAVSGARRGEGRLRTADLSDRRRRPRVHAFSAPRGAL